MRQEEPFFRTLFERNPWLRPRPSYYIFEVLTMVCLLLAGYCLHVSHMARMEWADSPLKEGEAVCVRAQQRFSRLPATWIANTWENSYRIAGVDHTAQEQDSCSVGRHYLLHYRIGDTGKLMVERGKLL